MKTLMKSFGTQLIKTIENEEERNQFQKRGNLVTMSSIEQWYVKVTYKVLAFVSETKSFRKFV